MTGSSSEGLRSIRSQAAHDGRAASQRIDRVEAQQRWALEVVAEALGPDALRVKLGQERALAFLVAAGWDAHKLARSDSRLWWAAVNPLPPHYEGIQPQIGQAIGALRQLQREQDQQMRHAQVLHDLRQRLFGPVTPADMPQTRPEPADQ